MDSKEGPAKGGIIQISNFHKPRNIFYPVFYVYTKFIMSKLLLKYFVYKVNVLLGNGCFI